MRAALLLVVLAGCWREPAREQTQPELSFVARMNVLADLRQRSSALAPRLHVATQRIEGLASENEREAIRQDLLALDRDLRALTQIAAECRARGEDTTELDRVDHQLARAGATLVGVHEDLIHAKTVAEREAFEELRKKTEGTLDDAPIRSRRLNVPGPNESPLLPFDRRQIDRPIIP